MLAQLYWIRQLFKASPPGYQPLRSASLARGDASEMAKEQAEDEAAEAAVQYAPIYAVGNLCIGPWSMFKMLAMCSPLAAGWLIFWLREGFNMSQILVTVNTALHLFAVARLPPLTASSSSLLWATHLVAKSTAGIGILDFVDNGGVALVSPSQRYQGASHWKLLCRGRGLLRVELLKHSRTLHSPPSPQPPAQSSARRSRTTWLLCTSARSQCWELDPGVPVLVGRHWLLGPLSRSRA